MTDREGAHPVACGYGLLGLCCVSCLKGPCRRSPFDDAVSGKSCGEDSDWIVAHNLMERVALESLQAMVAFRDVLERATGAGGRIVAPRMEEMRLFVSPFSRGPSALLEAIYPESAFPSLYSLGFPRGSWITELLDVAAGRPPARRDPEAILADALRLSAMAIAAEALSREPAGSTPKEIDVALPDSPSPLLLLISDEGGFQNDCREALMNEIDRTCSKEARIYRLPHAALLPSFSRLVFAKWGIPLSMTGSIAVVFSSSMIQGLGTLALGFSLVSLPGYPIQGSPLVEKYLTRDLKRKFGHAYLTIPPREDICEAISRSLTS
jgi:hypothetical protein